MYVDGASNFNRTQNFHNNFTDDVNRSSSGGRSFTLGLVGAALVATVALAVFVSVASAWSGLGSGFEVCRDVCTPYLDCSLAWLSGVCQEMEVCTPICYPI